MRDHMVRDGQLFQPDVLLPAQFFASMRKRVPREPEYRLIVAVLQDAIECFQKHLFARDQKMWQLHEDAREWIASDDRSWPYSFVSICEVLNLSPAYIRRGLEQWRENQVAARRHDKVLPLVQQQATARDQRDLTADVG